MSSDDNSDKKPVGKLFTETIQLVNLSEIKNFIIFYNRNILPSYSKCEWNPVRKGSLPILDS